MRRIPELDSIRGLAATTILLYHLVPATFHFGWAGVDCFFVLSSYLITSILLEYRKGPGFFVNFYARRSLRIWPIYYLCLVSLVAANAALRLGEPLEGLPYYATYTQNITLYWGQQPPPFQHRQPHVDSRSGRAVLSPVAAPGLCLWTAFPGRGQPGSGRRLCRSSPRGAERNHPCRAL